MPVIFLHKVPRAIWQSSQERQLLSAQGNHDPLAREKGHYRWNRKTYKIKLVLSEGYAEAARNTQEIVENYGKNILNELEEMNKLIENYMAQVAGL